MEKKAQKVIMKNLKLYNDDPVDGTSIITTDNTFIWNIIIFGPKDSIYEGGIFKATITFPDNFPLYPPKLVFNTRIYHPNIYENGEVCISILHPPGEDKYGYEDSAERWRPIHTINSILLSVISLFSAPNDESPANIDAAKDFRENISLFQHKVNKCVRDSIDNM